MDQSVCIGKNGEYHVLNLSHLLQNILAHHRFATSQQREVDTHLSSLLKNVAPLLGSKCGLAVGLFILGYSVSAGIATLAMQIAGG